MVVVVGGGLVVCVCEVEAGCLLLFVSADGNWIMNL